MAETERVPGHGGSRYCELSSIYVNSSLNCTFKYFVRMGCVNAHGYTINDSFKYQTWGTLTMIIVSYEFDQIQSL